MNAKGGFKSDISHLYEIVNERTRNTRVSPITMTSCCFRALTSSTLNSTYSSTSHEKQKDEVCLTRHELTTTSGSCTAKCTRNSSVHMSPPKVPSRDPSFAAVLSRIHTTRLFPPRSFIVATNSFHRRYTNEYIIEAPYRSIAEADAN